jgi:hypothetical protein
MSHLAFLNGERVVRLADGAIGTVHHAMMLPGEPWRYTVDFPDGERATLLAEELEHDDA